MKDLLMISPEDLLEEDIALLYEDSCKLGKAAPRDQRYWIAYVEKQHSPLHVISVVVRRREFFDLSPADDLVDLGENVVPIDTQGSISTGSVAVRIAGSVCQMPYSILHHLLVRIARQLCNYPYGPTRLFLCPTRM